MKKQPERKKKKSGLSPLYRPEGMAPEKWQTLLRREFGQTQSFRLRNTGNEPVFSEFSVRNPATGKSYRVAVRSEIPGENYCSCPDFSVNTLGTCKHIEYVLSRLRKNKKKREALAEGFRPDYSEVFLRYGLKRGVVFSAGKSAPEDLISLAGEYFDGNGVLKEESFVRFETFLKKASPFGHELRAYDDALYFIAERRDDFYRSKVLEKKYSGAQHSDGLLKLPLYPYQKEGAVFAARAGRALIGDDMGLGKTIQALAASEIMSREFGVEKVLVICPATLKHQWKQEIEKFSGKPSVVIEGLPGKRRRLYEKDAFFYILNYEIARRDLGLIKKLSADIVILDEAQRIKNWKTVTAKSIKQIESPYAMVLTGTPLENRLEELHSIVEFVDRYRLGPLFRFLHDHQELDPESGKVTGYRNLKRIGETLSPVLIRRRKEEVLKQLPERMEKNFFVSMTGEQKSIHDEYLTVVARIVAKWKRFRFLSEKDRRILLIALQQMRMSCDNAYLCDKKTRKGPKLGELETLLEEILEDEGVKVVIFSQWHRMTTLVSEVLDKKRWGYSHLHGGVPGHKRKKLIGALHDDPACRVFLSTDAGGVGLNLQAASVVINMDLPWNPAVLEQRVGRVHRLGQHKPVSVVNFVSEGTIEHGMLSVLSFKKSLFAGVLDGGEDNVFIGKSRLNKFMESVEAVTSAVPEAEEEQKKPSGPPADAPSGSLGELITAGAAFLQALSKNVSPEAEKPDFSRMLEKDEKTGRSYLRVPVPEKKVIKSVLPALESLSKVLSDMCGD